MINTAQLDDYYYIPLVIVIVTALTPRPSAADVTNVTATINHWLLCDVLRPAPLTTP